MYDRFVHGMDVWMDAWHYATAPCPYTYVTRPAIISLSELEDFEQWFGLIRLFEGQLDGMEVTSAELLNYRIRCDDCWLLNGERKLVITPMTNPFASVNITTINTITIITITNIDRATATNTYVASATTVTVVVVTIITGVAVNIVSIITAAVIANAVMVYVDHDLPLIMLFRWPMPFSTPIRRDMLVECVIGKDQPGDKHREANRKRSARRHRPILQDQPSGRRRRPPRLFHCVVATRYVLPEKRNCSR
jgi:hypothetical protein